VARAVSRVARLLRLALMPAGLNLAHATGPEAWQTVFHFHVHVIPRYRPEELRVMWQAQQAPDGELEALQRRVLACRGQLPDG
jgi:histidine triad (HIT) family protein